MHYSFLCDSCEYGWSCLSGFIFSYFYFSWWTEILGINQINRDLDVVDRSYRWINPCPGHLQQRARPIAKISLSLSLVEQPLSLLIKSIVTVYSVMYCTVLHGKLELHWGRGCAGAAEEQTELSLPWKLLSLGRDRNSPLFHYRKPGKKKVRYFCGIWRFKLSVYTEKPPHKCFLKVGLHLIL